MKRLIFDLDNTLCTTLGRDYKNAKPNAMMIEKIRQYKQNGFEIVISTSRNVRTYEGSIGKINANTLPVIIDWLREQEVPYDEIYVAKPWCGHDGFYVDDKAIRPQEFLDLSYAQICDLVGIGK
jgi:capsule biosynthesis phosphatase